MSVVSELSLPLVRYQFELVATTPLSFPPYAGSTWRGAFGSALRHTVCVTKQPQCQGCLLQRSCVYSVVFETPAGHEPLLAKGNSAPHPFILHPLDSSGRRYQIGDRLRIQFTLIGQALGYLPYFVHSVQQMGKHGLGQGKQGHYVLQSVLQEQTLGLNDWVGIYHTSNQALASLPVANIQIPPAPTAMRLHFKTPFRATHQGRLVSEEGFDLVHFLMGLIRRLSLLSAYHVSQRIEADFVALRILAQQLSMQAAEFHWYAWKRYSNRQQGLIAMDGLLGSFVLQGNEWQVFWPWLWWGQWVHSGKGTVLGLGEYTLEIIA